VIATPELSVVCVAGRQRHRLLRALEALAAQTIAERIELVLVDLGPPESRPEPPDTFAATTSIELPPDSGLGIARAAGARAARAEAVAFLVDHGYPEPGWAEALVGAYRDRWAAVGYAFKAANPEARAARAAMVAQFLPWLWPARGGETTSLPGNMVSYRSRVLRSLDDDLDALLDIDFVLHQRIQELGLAMAVEPGAVVREECYESLAETARANHVYSELLAVQRVRAGDWSRLRRLGYGLVSPVVVTVLRLTHAVGAASRGRRVGALLAALPAVIAVATVAALGESRGYLLGARGTTRARFLEWELNAPRARHPSGRSNATAAPSRPAS
jgi:glycosyltransferase involved in cell wall biosynthesis